VLVTSADVHHIGIVLVGSTAPHKYRDRPRDSASLGRSPGYQRYQKISRMLRQVWFNTCGFVWC
jgi:hypothetical protein